MYHSSIAGCFFFCWQRGWSLSDKFDYIMSQYQKLAGAQPLSFNNSMFLSEKESAHRNYALGHYLMENNCFPEGTNLQETMDLYFQVIGGAA
jgi:glutaminase